MDDDLFSKLPSEILISILEKVGLRDAYRARALSRTWRRLHDQIQPPRLALDIYDFLPGGETWRDDEFGIDSDFDDSGGDDDDDDEQHFDCGVDPDSDDDDDDSSDKEEGHGGGYRDTLTEASDKLLEAANAVLNNTKAGSNNNNNTLPVIARRILLRRNFMSLGRLLNDAVTAGKVTSMELSVTARFWLEESDDPLLAYARRFGNLLDRYPALFGCLTKLTLESMQLELDDVLAAACAKVESLSLFRLEQVTLRGWPSRFWLLKMHEQECDHLRDWAISTSPLPLAFGHVPCLTTLTVSNYDHRNGYVVHKLSRLLANTAVTDLRLNFTGSNIWIEPESQIALIDVFRNLKYLKVRNVHETCGIDWTMFLLQAAPLLKELYIKPLCRPVLPPSRSPGTPSTPPSTACWVSFVTGDIALQVGSASSMPLQSFPTFPCRSLLCRELAAIVHPSRLLIVVGLRVGQFWSRLNPCSPLQPAGQG
ncbi:hypothetical protein QOZ80_8AG0615060 [Eleusine coracana subsp. coracana]|nr:hypothetical protein QOZ80_8AG0615060 [Eleusine coracana subsp. coracana]